MRSTCLGRGISLPRSVTWYSRSAPISRIFMPLAQFPIDHADVNDHAAIIIIDAVENQRPRRLIRHVPGRRKLLAQLADQLVDPLPGLGRHENRSPRR